jgi:aconitate hydratase
MDRHVIANMGAELGATTSVFPADEAVREFLRRQNRESDYESWAADEGCAYDVTDEIDLGGLEPLIALPTSPGQVVPVREVAGREIYQAYVGSSANPGDRDFAIAAAMVHDRQIHPRVSFDINPTSRQQLENLSRRGCLIDLIRCGARIHQTGCNGCIGMGQAPASGRISLRTVPRNFPGRSGTREDSVYLCSPETATASAINGEITDPRDLQMAYPRLNLTDGEAAPNEEMMVPPLPIEEARRTDLEKGPNIAALPDLDPLPERLQAKVLLALGDDVSTDEILPAGSRVLPYRSNIPKISEFAFEPIDDDYARRARQANEHAIVAGSNYGQGSSREHAALATRYLGLRLVLARSFARIHAQNLVNFGVLPLIFENGDHHTVAQGDVLRLNGLHRALREGSVLAVETDGGTVINAHHDLSARQVEILIAGGLIPWIRAQRTGDGPASP